MVDVVDAHLLVIHHLPAQRKLIPHTVGKGQGLGNPTGIEGRMNMRVENT